MEGLHPEGLVKDDNHGRNGPTHRHSKEHCQATRGLSKEISTGGGADRVVELMEEKV